MASFVEDLAGELGLRVDQSREFFVGVDVAAFGGIEMLVEFQDLGLDFRIEHRPGLDNQGLEPRVKLLVTRHLADLGLRT